MSEEQNTQEQKGKCFCKNEAVGYFLATTLGTFIGVYFALFLSNTFFKPTMPPNPVPIPQQQQMQGPDRPDRNHEDFGPNQQPPEFKGGPENQR